MSHALLPSILAELHDRITLIYVNIDIVSYVSAYQYEKSRVRALALNHEFLVVLFEGTLNLYIGNGSTRIGLSSMLFTSCIPLIFQEIIML